MANSISYVLDKVFDKIPNPFYYQEWHCRFRNIFTEELSYEVIKRPREYASPFADFIKPLTNDPEHWKPVTCKGTIGHLILSEPKIFDDVELIKDVFVDMEELLHRIHPKTTLFKSQWRYSNLKSFQVVDFIRQEDENRKKSTADRRYQLAVLQDVRNFMFKLMKLLTQIEKRKEKSFNLKIFAR